MPHFYQAHIKGIKSDFVKGEIAIGFVVDFDEENAELARELSHYAEAAAGDVEITITPRQISLFDNAPQVTEEETVSLPVFDPENPDVPPVAADDVVPILDLDGELITPYEDSDPGVDTGPFDGDILPDVGPWEEEEFEEEVEEV